MLPLLFGVLFCLLFYSWLRWGMTPIAALVGSVAGLNKLLPFRVATLVVQVPLYGVPGIVIYSILSLVAPDSLVPFGVSATGLVDGALVGIGLAAAGSALGRGSLVFTTLLFRRGGGRPKDPFKELESFADTGWLRGYSLAQKYWPRAGYLLAFVGIAGEEFLHRGIVLPLCVKSLGVRYGLMLSIAIFVWFQAIGMPSLLVAQVPMAGALVIGSVLGYLAITDGRMFPLVLAHFVFFVCLVYLGPKAAELRKGGARAQYAGY
ncbi:MAG TPA: CPBP family intramembrane glutamic endopeptidase [Bryobacteraceae bacterium]